MKVFVDIEIMTKTSEEFMATLEISVISKRSKVRKKFYKSDYIRTADTIEEAVDNFCKFLLKEYFELIKKSDDKDIVYLIICYAEVSDLINRNMYIDQLKGYLEYPSGVYVQLKEEN